LSETRTAGLAVTMGDPAGIGPEIVVKALGAMAPAARPLVVGDVARLAEVARRLGAQPPVRAVAAPEARTGGDGIDVLEVGALDPELRRGAVSAAAGAAAYGYVTTAIDLALARRIDGLVTAPLHKEALAAAGVPFPGHTEMLAHHAGGSEVAMMLATPDLRVVLVTIHEPLAAAIARLDQAMQRRAIRFAAEGARAFGIARPRIAVAGVNPHAGEGGRFGREEIEIVAPAIAAARAEGFDVTGPLPGDAVFRQARAGRFDVVVAQYHDQGLIPIKLGGLADGVNVTLGLPFVRTSPDHGTAFDIADDFVADPASLAAAIATAGRLAAARNRSTLV
jgi:4-hydroxythreonine-4-phosphate dehydrogenase